MNVRGKESVTKGVRVMANEQNVGGRPRKYTKVTDMQKEIDKYFIDCDDKEEPYTFTGLALALGFYGRQELLNYLNYVDENGDKFSDTIKRARSKVESSIEKGLISGKYNATGAIFNLKNNFGWKDKQEVETSGEHNMNVKIEVIKDGH